MRTIAPLSPLVTDGPDRKITSSKQTSILADQKKSALLIHSVQHTSNKTQVPTIKSSDILKRPQKFLKESSIFL